MKSHVSARGMLLVAILIGGSMCLGCSGGTPGSVSGQVTWEGQPLEAGNIRFDPTEESEGASGSSLISAGKYSIPHDSGMLAGKYLVSITATKATGKQIRRMDSTTAMTPEIVLFIPDRYNVRSTLDIELKGGANLKDFTLTSKP